MIRKEILRGLMWGTRFRGRDDCIATFSWISLEIKESLRQLKIVSNQQFNL
jgi:hypothetical protein